MRWASDCVDENGIVAFVSNSSFINGRTFDGFRKCVGEEFNEIRIGDLKGNRSALEWVLDQYKQKTPKNPTIREKFNTYRFAGYKE